MEDANAVFEYPDGSQLDVPHAPVPHVFFIVTVSDVIVYIE